MARLSRDSLLTLEDYAKGRKEFRAQVIAHKKARTVHLGQHVTLLFEDALTMRYQVQEMLLHERIFEEAAIQNELDAYSPLVPDGSNLKATMLIEYDDPGERKTALASLKGIADKVWMQAAEFARVFAVADEDLERENADKTSAVHFLRFEFSAPMIVALKGGGALAIGVDHRALVAELPAVPEALRKALVADFT